jgi:serine/threonine-protein kinase RIO1
MLYINHHQPCTTDKLGDSQMRKLIQTINNAATGKTAKVYRDSESSEFVVRLYQDGVLQSEADYFTGFDRYFPKSVQEAKEEAINTAEHMTSNGCI